MALTKTQISELYVSIFNRASEKSGSQNWLNSGYNTDATTMANAMLATDAAKTYFGTSLDSNAAFVEHIYANTLNKGGATVDAAGKAGWVEFLKTGASRGEMVAKMIEAIKEYQVGGAKYATADQTTKDAAQQFENRVKVSDYTADNLETIAVSEINSTLSFSSALTVTADPATVETAKKSVQALTIDGTTFSLTNSVNGDSFVGTAKNDLFISAAGTLSQKDTILDSSTTDHDILNAEVTDAALDPRIQNVETINMTGKYVTTGLNLASVSGTKDLNLDTKIIGGTASVLNASSLNALNIKATANIDELTVTATASGTRDTVFIDASSTKAVNVKGNAGTDSFDVTLQDGATVNLTPIAGTGDIDTYTLNTTGGKIKLGGSAVAKELIINNTTAALEVELTNGQTLVGGAKSKWNIEGDADVTLVVADDAAAAAVITDINGKVLVNSGTGKTTLKILDPSFTTTETDLSRFVADEVQLATAGGAAVNLLKVNQGSVVNLTKDAGATSITLNVDNDAEVAGDKIAVNTGTLMLNVSEDNAGKIISGAKVKTVLLKATPDEVKDTDKDANGTNERAITIKEIDTNANAGAEKPGIVAMGSDDLKVLTWTNKADAAFSAGSMTGNLTIGQVTNAFAGTTAAAGTIAASTISLGSGVNTVNVFAGSTIYGGTNTDKITISTGTNRVETGAGNDTVTTAATGTNTIKTGSGDDTVNVKGGTNTITLGDGADTVKLDENKAGSTVTDFVKGTDVLSITGSTTQATKAINLGSVSVTNGVYALSNDGAAANAAGEWSVTLENGGSKLNATDMRDSIQLSGVTLLNNSTNVLGSLNDSVVVLATSDATITTGAGSDSVEIKVGAIATTKATVKDFTVGEDKIILGGDATITAGTSVDLASNVASSGVYTVGSLAAGYTFKLENNGSDIVTANNLTEMVQLGTSVTNQFIVTGITGGTHVTAAGGKFNDFVQLVGNTATGTATYKFTNNGGTDTIELAAGTGGVELLNFAELTGMNATAIGATKTVATTSKIGDATDGGLYIYTSSKAGVDGTKITTFEVDTNNGITQDVINDQVAAYINAGLGTSNGETYVVIINDDSTAAYANDVYGNAVYTAKYDSYAYLVKADADGVQADDITLIGVIKDASGTTDSTDIA